MVFFCHRRFFILANSADSGEVALLSGIPFEYLLFAKVLSIGIQNEDGYAVTCVDLLSNSSGKELVLIYYGTCRYYIYVSHGWVWVSHACADPESFVEGVLSWGGGGGGGGVEL